MHAQKAWSHGTGPSFGCPTLENWRISVAISDVGRAEFPWKVGYDTLERVEYHVMTDVKGVPLVSYDMHVVYRSTGQASLVA
jgi:hypothetical protein